MMSLPVGDAHALGCHKKQKARGHQKLQQVVMFGNILQKRGHAILHVEAPLSLNKEREKTQVFQHCKTL